MPQPLPEQPSRAQQIEALEKDWATNPRWKGLKRGYGAADVVRLRGSLQHGHLALSVFMKTSHAEHRLYPCP